MGEEYEEMVSPGASLSAAERMATKSSAATSADVVRDMSSETVCGFRVAAYRETHPEHGDKYGHRYSEHWSTPSSRNPAVKVERLFTEEQLRAAIDRRADPLDEAWAAVNVLGAPDTACRTAEDLAYCRGIGDALAEIEKLGGRSN